MEKDFDAWNKEKKLIHTDRAPVQAEKREVWWCALGNNIGVEVDGKNRNFERPALVLRVYNLYTLLVLPFTSQEKSDRFHYGVYLGAKKSWVMLTQARVISSQRLLRVIDKVPVEEFREIQSRFRGFT